MALLFCLRYSIYLWRKGARYLQRKTILRKKYRSFPHPLTHEDQSSKSFNKLTTLSSYANNIYSLPSGINCMLRAAASNTASGSGRRAGGGAACNGLLQLLKLESVHVSDQLESHSRTCGS